MRNVDREKWGQWLRLPAHVQEIAERVAYHRAKRSEQYGDGHGEPVRSWAQRHFRHRVGCYGEAAYATMIGVKWPEDENDFGKKGDWDGIEIRTTTRQSGTLKIYDGEPDDRCYVLMIITPDFSGAFRYAGAIFGDVGRRVGKRSTYGRRNAICVGQKDLKV